MRSMLSSSSMFVYVGFCISHSYLFFILLLVSVVFAIIIDSLVSVQGYR